MRASELYERLSQRRRQALEDVWGGGGTQAGAPACWTDEAACRRLHVKLSGSERAVLSVIVRRFGMRGFTQDDVDRLNEPGGAAAARQAAFLRLRRKGIVFTMKTRWGDRVHFMPRDAFPVWQRLVLGRFPAREAPAAGSRASGAATGRPHGLSGALFTLLKLVSEEEWALTKKGALPADAVRRAVERLAWGGDELAHFPVKHAHQADSPKRFALVTDMALRLGLLRVRAGRVRPDDEAVADWLAQPAADRERRLMELWHDVHLPEDVWLQHAAAALSSLPAGEWIALDAFAAWLQSHRLGDAPSRLDEAVERLRDRWLKALAFAGWLALGEAGGREAFRIEAPKAEAPDELYVLEDYEIVVPPDVSLKTRWRLAPFCETIVSDETERLRLTRKRALAALESGRSALDLLALLEETSAAGVPDHVRRSLLEWQAAAGRVRLADVRLLRCADEAAADELGRVPELAPLLAERVGPRDYIVAPGADRALARRLEQLGYASGRAVCDKPRAEDEEPSGPYDSAWANGLVRPIAALPSLELDDDPPPVHALYPDLKRLPQMWLNELRAYHESTCKELIRKAIQYRASVRIRRSGQEAEIAPLRLEEGGSDWSLHALSQGAETRLRPGDWQQIQLILPGINDTNELIAYPQEGEGR